MFNTLMNVNSLNSGGRLYSNTEHIVNQTLKNETSNTQFSIDMPAQNSFVGDFFSIMMQMISMMMENLKAEDSASTEYAPAKGEKIESDLDLYPLINPEIPAPDLRPKKGSSPIADLYPLINPEIPAPDLRPKKDSSPSADLYPLINPETPAPDLRPTEEPVKEPEQKSNEEIISEILDDKPYLRAVYSKSLKNKLGFNGDSSHAVERKETEQRLNSLVPKRMKETEAVGALIDRTAGVSPGSSTDKELQSEIRQELKDLGYPKDAIELVLTDVKQLQLYKEEERIQKQLDQATEQGKSDSEIFSILEKSMKILPQIDKLDQRSSDLIARLNKQANELGS